MPTVTNHVDSSRNVRGHWAASTVRAMLRNPVYPGRIVWNRLDFTEAKHSGGGVGSDRIAAEAVDERMRESIEVVLQATFKPEFLNRIDDGVIFHRLSRDDIGRIVDLQVALLAERISEKGLAIELTDGARTLLGNLGYDPTYGARPLKRVIQRRVVDPLALRLLEGDFAEGDLVRVDAADGELVFKLAGELEPSAA